MGRLFGTDGARGIANTELTCELAMNIGRAAAITIAHNNSDNPTILIGRDTRISSEMLESALVAGICSVGANVSLIGVVPTPAVAYLVDKYNCDAGIMISASHNPVEFNGIKLFNNEGFKLSDELEEEIEELILDTPENMDLKKTGTDLGRIYHRTTAVEDYVNHLVSTIEGDLKGLKIIVDCANGSASATAKLLFEKLGANANIIHSEPDGSNINCKCGSTHMDNLRKYAKEHKCDVAVAFDGDADRCLAIDENGEDVDGDKMIAIFAKDMFEKNSLKNDTVVVTVMTNLGFFHFTERVGISTQATKVGDRYVLENMRQNGHVLGGEQSGHIIFSDFACTGDGQLSAIQLLSVMKHTGKTLSELSSIMEHYPQVLLNITANSEEKKLYEQDNEIQEYIRKKDDELGSDGRVLVRLSGTEPLIRVMVEGKDLNTINNTASDIVNMIKQKLGLGE